MRAMSLFKALVVVFIIGIITAIFFIISNLPDIDVLRDVRMQIPLRVYSQDGALIAEFGEKRRAPVLIDEVPEQLVQAFIAAEDESILHPSGSGLAGPGASRYLPDKDRGEKTGWQYYHNAGCPQFFPVPGKILHEKTE